MEVIMSDNGTTTSAQQFWQQSNTSVIISVSPSSGRLRWAYNGGDVNWPNAGYDQDTLTKHASAFYAADGNQAIANRNGVYDSTLETDFVSVITATSNQWGHMTRLNNVVTSVPTKLRQVQIYDGFADFDACKALVNELMMDTLTMTAGTSGPKQGYETAVMGTLAPDDPFGFTINELSEQSNDIVLIVEGIVAQTIFETIEIDGVVLTMLAADTFTTGAGVSTWTFDNTTINLISTVVYPVKVQVGQ
jgi:hypothetical protein